MAELRTQSPALPYVTPFAVFITSLLIGRWAPLSVAWAYSLRCALVLLVLVFLSRRAIPLQPEHWAGSFLLGLGVFVIWVGPDVLWPGYRTHWLLQNALTGSAESSLPDELKSNVLFLTLRVAESVILVPILEELFWRGWLMRWLIDQHFQTVPLGAYTALSFWAVALLFASEHGPYWEVGLIAGIAYNWWIIRTRNLFDCILSHAVTNACLSAYILLAGQWQYWL